MSKNFELLMEIEKEFAPAEPDHRQESAAVSIPAPATVELLEGEDEMAPLVQRVFLPAAGTAHRQVVFCGIEAANPSSSVCARAARNLAARTHERVCLVNANPSRADLARQFKVEAELDGNATTAEQCLPVASNLWLTKCNGMNGGGEQAVNGLRARLAELQREFGYVLIDAPGCLASENATMLGQVSDALVLVVEADATHRQAASKAKQNLEAAGVRLAGTVLNNRSFPIPKALYERL